MNEHVFPTQNGRFSIAMLGNLEIGFGGVFFFLNSVFFKTSFLRNVTPRLS